ncbi:methyltransferase domain-containing protein [bacterium]|nr:methyltransferase domain-containing protein [bacterium]
MKFDQEKLQDVYNLGNSNIGFAHRAKTNRNSHFSRIASAYEDLRTTDIEQIIFIRNNLHNLTSLKGADIGCGCGRYTAELFRILGDKLHLTCIDENEDMLKQLTKNLEGKDLQNFDAVKAPANNLPVESNSLDFIVSFNAMHHFDIIGFLNESSRTLKDNGYLFIYTRLRSQNKRNIWGRYFPKFHEKETRLCDLEKFKIVLEKTRLLKLDSVKYFMHKRRVSTNWLIGRAIHHHYSTFDLYDRKEFDNALLKFRKNIVDNFSNRDDIFWEDENTMFVIRKNVQ